MPITNYELRITDLKSSLRFFVILFVLCVFVCASFAQETTIAQNQDDWAEKSILLSRLITGGTIEQKRDALIQIRNLETAEASRLAIPALKDSSEIVRATAAASVIFLPSAEAAQILTPLLADKKPFVRREAGYALGRIGEPNSVNPLLRALQKDKVLEVRNAAVVALGEIGDVAAVVELVKFLQRKPQAKEEFTRRSAARSIGQIAQIVQTKRRKVVTPEDFLPEQFKSIKQPTYPRLAEAFPAFRQALPALIRTLQNPNEFQDVKREAAFALGAIGDEAALPVLQINANDADYYLAAISRESLRKIAVASNR